MSDFLSFHLKESFVDGYRDRKVPWGLVDAHGTSVSEITYLRTYSRIKPDGNKETWVDTCERVINGMYSIQKDHAAKNNLPWNDNKAQRSAEEAFDRMFELKWTPPGRGIWTLGTELINKYGIAAAAQNCAFISTGDMARNNPGEPFAWVLNASTLGIGCGFDTEGSKKQIEIRDPGETTDRYTIPDTREGWAESVRLLINSYLAGGKSYYFDYSEIRPAGSPIKTFGGTASGPAPLVKLHEEIVNLLGSRVGQLLDSLLITDLMNMIGVCVVSGNVRRSAEIAVGNIDDDNFVNAKDFDKFPYRAGHGWMSNNTVKVNVGDDLSGITEGIKLNGEPGVLWLDTARNYGRLKDGPDYKDHRVTGVNPCAEQMLESGEMCTLAETYINRHESLEDYQRTLKFAFLYGKTVTLLDLGPEWSKTNAIMQRNRRIGLSMSGIANFADNRGLPELRRWMNTGYETVRRYDHSYSEWLCVRESIRVTTVKPSGTVSLLAGESPGVHWAPGGEYYNRGIVFSKTDPMVQLFRDAGYDVQDSAYTPETSVFIQFPIKSNAKRSEKDVSIYEKISLAATAQEYWSDNAVSVTVSFHAKDEAEDVPKVLSMFDGKLKTVSFLPMGNTVYDQQPYQELSQMQYNEIEGTALPVDLSSVYSGKALDAVGEAGCTNDTCEIPKP